MRKHAANQAKFDSVSLIGEENTKPESVLAAQGRSTWAALTGQLSEIPQATTKLCD